MVVRVCEVATDQKVGDSSPSERTPECALIKGVDPVAAWASGPMTLAATRGGLVQHVLSNSTCLRRVAQGRDIAGRKSGLVI